MAKALEEGIVEKEAVVVRRGDLIKRRRIVGKIPKTKPSAVNNIRDKTARNRCWTCQLNRCRHCRRHRHVCAIHPWSTNP